MTYAEAEGSRRDGSRSVVLRRGHRQGNRVGLYFPYWQEWVVAWMAASRIGAL